MSKCLKKFEYTRIYCEVDHNELDMMGEAGWELVAIELSKSVGLPTLWFKREKKPYLNKEDLNGKISRRDS